MSEIVALIPARSGSKGVINKNLRQVGGKSLLEWSVCACLKTNLIDRTIVSTDSEYYAKEARNYGAEVPFIRPDFLSDDMASDYGFVDHALNHLVERGEKPNIFIHIRPTTPFRDPELINKAIETFFANNHATSLRSVHLMPESAYKTFEINSDGLLMLLGSNSTSLDSANEPRQSFPKTYYPNGYVDILSVEHIQNTSLLHGDKVIPFITPYTEEVDSLDDLNRLELINQQCPEYFQKVFQV